MSRTPESEVFVRWVIWLTLPVSLTIALGVLGQLLPGLGLVFGGVWMLAAWTWVIATPIAIAVALVKWLMGPRRPEAAAE